MQKALAYPILECLQTSLSATPESSFLLMHTDERGSDDSSSWLPSAHMGGTDGVLNPMLWPGPTPATEGI